MTTTTTTTTDFTKNVEYWLAYDAALATFKKEGFTDLSDDVAVDALVAAGAAAIAYATWEDVADTVDAAWAAATLAAKNMITHQIASSEYNNAVAAEKEADAARTAAVNALYAQNHDAASTVSFRQAAAAANRARQKTTAAKVAVDARKPTVEVLTLESSEGRTFRTSLVGLEIFGWCFNEHYISQFRKVNGLGEFPTDQEMADTAAEFEYCTVYIRCEGGQFRCSIDNEKYLTCGSQDVLSDLNLLARLGDLREMEKIVPQPRSTKVAIF
jgi:hypothetical protein